MRRVFCNRILSGFLLVLLPSLAVGADDLGPERLGMGSGLVT
jgi:hypothetical protein